MVIHPHTRINAPYTHTYIQLKTSYFFNFVVLYFYYDRFTDNLVSGYSTFTTTT